MDASWLKDKLISNSPDEIKEPSGSREEDQEQGEAEARGDNEVLGGIKVLSDGLDDPLLVLV